MARQKSGLAWPIFAQIAPHEFLVASLTQTKSVDTPNATTGSTGARPNGRATDESRPYDIHMGALSQAHGSAAVRLGRTRAICGVRGEILPVDHIPNFRPSGPPREPGGAIDASEADNRRQLRDYDLLVPNLELATGSSPAFLPGGPPSVLAQVLSTRLYAMLHSSGLVDAEALKIWHHPERAKLGVDVNDDDANEADEDDLTPVVMAYWTLYIDIVFLSLDGNPLDAAWAAIVAALRDTRLPTVRWDADHNRVVRVPPPAPTVPLVLRGCPAAVTFAVCVENSKKQQLQSRDAAAANRFWVLHDPDQLEEDQCRETVTVVVDCTTGTTVVRALSKSGGELVGSKAMHSLVALAAKRWTALSSALEQGL